MIMRQVRRQKTLYLILVAFIWTLCQPLVLLADQNRLSARNNGSHPEDFVEVAKDVLPTVVSIQSTQIVESRDIWKEQYDYEDLQDFFGEERSSSPVPRIFRQKGSGSGVVISDDGFILTNVHVIENAEDIRVTLSDKRTFSAGLIGIDPLTEVAVVKIECENLPVSKFGNSDFVEIGEWVLAVGNPLGLNSTVTAGIISAKGRDINIIRDTYGVENFIQTDAAINPGNSGGPLVNMHGEVIGITTAIATESGYSQGYGFAIPVNLAKDIARDLIDHGRVIRAYLGVSMQNIDEKRARALGLKRPVGVFIDHVTEDGPAIKAGLRPKDILFKIDQKSVNSTNVVQSLIAKKDPGDEVILSVIRKNTILKLKIILIERITYVHDRKTEKIAPNYRNLGIEAETLKRRLASDLGLLNRRGIVVTGVERFSPAHDAGVQINDVILEIGDTEITSIETFHNIMDRLTKGDVIIMKIRRKNTSFHGFIEVPY